MFFIIHCGIDIFTQVKDLNTTSITVNDLVSLIALQLTSYAFLFYSWLDTVLCVAVTFLHHSVLSINARKEMPHSLLIHYETTLQSKCDFK